MILKLLPQNDPMLKMKSVDFDFSIQPSIELHDSVKLFESLKETMIANNGIGLSAIQVGIALRVFVIGDPSNPESIIPVFNPIIVDKSDDMEYYEEGCLSFPGLFVKVKRPKAIRVRFADTKGDVQTIKYEGITARVFQHEYDHMDGILYTRRANPYHLDLARNQKRKLDKMKNAKLRG
jgi:peptide deformylase